MLDGQDDHFARHLAAAANVASTHSLDTAPGIDGRVIPYIKAFRRVDFDARRDADILAVVQKLLWPIRIFTRRPVIFQTASKDLVRRKAR